MTLHGGGAEITTPTSSAQTPLNARPLLATSDIAQHLRFPIPTWAVRGGRTMQHFLWEQSIVKLAAAFGLTPEHLLEDAPTLTSYTAQMAARPASTRAKVTVTEDMFNQHLLDWMAVNSAIYWHVLPSLDISGTHLLSDTRAVNRFYTVYTRADGTGATVADGRGLIKWARKHVDKSSKEDQKRLQRSLGKASLKAGASRAQFNLHAEKLFQTWSLK